RRTDCEACAREDLVQIRGRRAVPDEEARYLVVHAAEPDEAARIEFCLRGADERFHRHAAADDGDLAAVLGGRVVKIAGEIERAPAGSVLRDDDGVARQIFAEMTGDQAAVGVVTITGGRIADQQLDLLAGKRHRLGLRLRRRSSEQHEHGRQSGAEPRASGCPDTRARGRACAPHSAARSSRVASRWATTSSTCITSAYLWCMSNRLTLCVSSARS